MKKLLLGALTFLVGSVFFAQNLAFIESMEKAEEFRDEKNWVRALGAYWDAMEAEPTSEAYVAYAAYADIAYAVKNGNPGLGEFSASEKNAGWEKIMEEFEVYWTENCPRQFEFTKFSTSQMDSTATSIIYTTSLKLNWTPKYQAFLDIFANGYSKIKTEEMLDWPKNAISKGDGIENQKSKTDRHLASIYKPTLYKISFNVTDEDGKILFENCSIRGGENYLLKYLEPEVKAKFDEGKIRIVPTSLVLQNKKDPYVLKDVYIASSYDEDIKGLQDVTEIVRKSSLDLSFKDDFPRMLKMVNLPEGSFSMGSSRGAANQKPVHTVKISSFDIGSTEVTQELYTYVMGENPSLYKGERVPVASVSWFDAIMFCNKLSVMAGLRPCYTVDEESDVEKWNYIPNAGNKIDGFVECNFKADGFRLPTEAEWEYAAKSAGQDDYEFSGGSVLSDVGFYGDGKTLKPQDVGLKKPNSSGLYDMSGNVWEWCWDWFSKYSKDTLRNPTGDSGGFNRICRGGSCLSLSGNCTVSYRFSKVPEKHEHFIGFRIARSVKPAPKTAVSETAE